MRRLTPVCLLLCLSSPLLAAVSDGELQEAIRRAYNYDARGGAVFKKMIQEAPEHPRGYFLMATLEYWNVLRDPRRDDWAEVAESAIKEAIEVANAYADARDDDRESTFYRGMAYAVKTMFNLTRENMWTTFWNGRRSLNIMEELLEAHPDLHDAKLIPGVANCYLDDAPGYLKPVAALMGYRGDTETGLRLLQECIAMGELASTEAAWYLGTVHLEITFDFAAAAEIFTQLVEDQPNNPFMRYRLVRAYELAQDYEAALEACAYPEELNAIPAHTHRLFWLRFRQVLMLHRLNRNEEALALCDPLIADYEAAGNEPRLLAATLRLKGGMQAVEGDVEGALETLNRITRRMDKEEHRAAEEMMETLQTP